MTLWIVSGRVESGLLAGVVLLFRYSSKRREGRVHLPHQGFTVCVCGSGLPENTRQGSPL